MIQEVFILHKNGRPIFHQEEREEPDSDRPILRAGFLSAMESYGKEVDNQNVEMIELEHKSYLVYNFDEYLMVFALESDNGDIGYEEVSTSKDLIKSTTSKLLEIKEKYNIEEFKPTENYFEEAMDEFQNFLEDQKILGEELDQSDTVGRYNKLQNMFYDYIGYQPGVCNIGPSERLKRLKFAFYSFNIAWIALAVMIMIDLPRWYRLFLAFPVMAGFVSYYQYLFRFCVHFGTTQQYNLN